MRPRSPAVLAAAAITAAGVALSAPALASSAAPREHSCLAQMRALREVSRAAGITIGSAFIAPDPRLFRPQRLKRLLDSEGLPKAGRAVANVTDIGTNQRFVRVMTDTAARIMDGAQRCSGGLPLA